MTVWINNLYIDLELPARLDPKMGQWLVAGLCLMEFRLSASGKILPLN